MLLYVLIYQFVFEINIVHEKNALEGIKTETNQFENERLNGLDLNRSGWIFSNKR